MTREVVPMKPSTARGIRLFFSALFLLCALVVLALAGTLVGIVGSYASNLPNISRLSVIEPTFPTVIVARDGTRLARLYDKYKVYVPITRIPTVMRQAVVAVEDERFYGHRGVDLHGIVRAAYANYKHEHITQGASTITQQLARALFLTNRQNIDRKIQEALLAMQIERYYSKDEILERYLNLVYFGAGAYGVQAASHAYFGKDVSLLTLPQAAMLAGLIAAPSLYSPYSSPQRANERQRHVLDRMVAVHYITAAHERSALQQKLTFSGTQSNGIASYRYPYFATYVIAELVKDFGYDQVYRGGLTVYTSLDPRLQDLAQTAVTDGVQRGAAEGFGMHQGALVAEDPRTGQVLAMVGGVGFSPKSQFNRGWQARRQPGSSFKGYVYSAAVDRGMPVSTVYEDAPVSYPAGDGTDYRPQDDDHQYMGAINLRRAFELSRNIVAVRLANDVGISTVIDYAHRMGITEELEPDLSLALGSNVVSPLDMASGFSTLADGGIYTPPTSIRYVEDQYGLIVLDNRFPQHKPALSQGAAFIMTSLMQGVIQEGTGYPNAVIGRPAAGKTGTTSDFRDAWFVGFVPQLTAAVWVGNDDYSRMNESYGGNVPARIWASFMKSALKGTAVQSFDALPPDVQKVRLCTSDRRALPGYGGRSEYFLNGTAPLAYCAERAVARASRPRPSPSPSATPQSIVVPVGSPLQTEAPAAPSEPTPLASPSAEPAPLPSPLESPH
ncbi:MAG: PBP1A family penicillin-binding protein [Candidatus Eremiobacteraeota bacterium]|nr:PBP1A family penicillin-binding protein [Candidatus Eremiobacteraeota bacterium]